MGHGRVGEPVAAELARHGVPHVIVDQSRAAVESLRERGRPAIAGDATRPEVLGAARVARARLVVVAVPDAYQGRAILAAAREAAPALDVLVRTHSDAERAYLEAHGAAEAFVGARELAVSLTRAALHRVGEAPDMAGVAGRSLRPAEVRVELGVDGDQAPEPPVVAQQVDRERAAVQAERAVALDEREPRPELA